MCFRLPSGDVSRQLDTCIWSSGDVEAGDIKLDADSIEMVFKTMQLDGIT